MIIIFDWDGTIIDSRAKIVGCMQQAAADCDVPPQSEEAISNIIGLELTLAIQTLYPQLPPPVIEKLRERYAHRFVEADAQPCNLFARVEETLTALHRDGHQLCVATGKSRRGLDRVFGRLPISELFVASRCADETRSKPDPLMLHELCEELAARPQEALMVGDTEYDLAMAKGIDMPAVGVSYGAHAPARLAALQPLALIDCFSELLPIVNSQSGHSTG